MTERTKVERRIAVYLASEESTGSPDTTPFPERARDVYDNFVMPAEKQVRAEVLAAYQRAIVEWRNSYGAMPEDSPVFLVATKLLDIITKLQPAAKALEEFFLRSLNERFKRVCKLCAGSFLHYSKNDICCQCRVNEALVRTNKLAEPNFPT